MASLRAKVALVAVACGLAGPALAQETGLDALHAQVRVGGKICMVDHFHYGSSNGASSRKQAERQAVLSWAEFTAWEYGDNWGSWRLSVSKGVKCDGSGSSWTCNVEARPCKPAGRSARRRR